jgi:hypothetical protein
MVVVDHHSFIREQVLRNTINWKCVLAQSKTINCRACITTDVSITTILKCKGLEQEHLQATDESHAVLDIKVKEEPIDEEQPLLVTRSSYNLREWVNMRDLDEGSTVDPYLVESKIGLSKKYAEVKTTTQVMEELPDNNNMLRWMDNSSTCALQKNTSQTLDYMRYIDGEWIDISNKFAARKQTTQVRKAKPKPVKKTSNENVKMGFINGKFVDTSKFAVRKKTYRN